jgi:ABC-type transport system involved in multi-copper enzyme maturation permease subunit
MIDSLKAEFRKIFTVRSTYVIAIIAFLLVVLFAFYAEGLRASASAGANPGLMASGVRNAVMTVSILGAIVGMLLVTHEYRYNTIMYTLTASSSRTKTLLAKLIAISVFAMGFALIFGILSPLLTWLGLTLKGIEMVPQQIPVWDTLWRILFYAWGFSMFAALLGFLIRNQVGVIAALFMIPATVEPLMGLLLKSNAVYLPFTLLTSVVERGPRVTVTHAALVSAGYILGVAIITWQLFVRRDAN